MKILILLVSLLAGINTWSQTACFNIESILVDACGNPEGQNEMIRLKIGNANLNVSDLTVNWPNNAFLGICQNAVTAQKVQQMNASVTSCGVFLEPTQGILPAQSSVLIITSVNFDPSAHNYAGLSDTLFVLFQCAGNTSGHFANWIDNCDISTGNRITSVSFGNGCSKTVTYNRCFLTNQNNGIGGSAADRDGARVDFTANGATNYINEGCTIPYEPLSLAISTVPNQTLCTEESYLFSCDVSGTYTALTWSCAYGTFSNNNGVSTLLTPNQNFTGSAYLFVEAVNGCGETIKDSVLVDFSVSPEINQITATNQSGNCGAGSVEVEIASFGTILWNTGETSSNIFPDETGWYIAEVTTNCGTVKDSIFVNLDGNLSYTVDYPMMVCLDDLNASIMLTAQGGTAPYTFKYQLNQQNIETQTQGNMLEILIPSNQAGYVDFNVLELSDATLACSLQLNDNYSIEVLPELNWSITIDEQLCANGATHISIVVNNGLPPFLLNYSTNGLNNQTVVSDSSGIFDFSIIVPNNSDSLSIYFNSLTSTAIPCPTIMDIEFVLPVNQAPLINQSADTSVCVFSPDLTLSFLPQDTNNTFDFTYGINGVTWMEEDVQQLFINHTNETPGIYTYLLNTMYDYTSGCSFTLNHEIIVNVVAPPKVDFDFSPTVINQDFPIVQFTNLTEGGTSFYWDFGDGQGWSNDFNPSYIFDQDLGLSFTVQLIAENLKDCADTLVKLIAFDQENYVFIPNAFTPDGNEYNPTFGPVFSDISKIENINFIVFNRWGEQVFQTTDLNQTWDGSYMGVLCPTGTYVWKLSVTYIGSEMLQKNAGHVTLLR